MKDVESIRKRYGDKLAKEWFVRVNDMLTFERASINAREQVEKATKKMTILFILSMVTSITVSITCFWRCRYRERE